MKSRPSSWSPAARALSDLTWDHARASLTADGRSNEPATAWTLSLALLQATTEFRGLLDDLAERAAVNAVTAGASYGAVGAARGISRQAARKAYHELVADRRAWQDGTHPQQLEDRYSDRTDPSLDPWPPRPWRRRAPAGMWTVALTGGPLDGQQLRIAVGNDAYPHVDNVRIFGRLQERHARYSPSRAGSNRFEFSGEYYIRYR